MTFFSFSRMMKHGFTKGHSTTASMRVSKTLDRGSIPRAPAIESESIRRVGSFSMFDT